MPGGDAHVDYIEAVLSVIDDIPPARVTTYGLIAEALGAGGPRQVAAVLSREGGSVAWWRVIRADGTLPESLRPDARARYLEEGTPLRPDGRVDMRQAVWIPGEPMSDPSVGIGS
jgi:alkylated DNA nucleotide flippase Atl1